MTQVRQYYGESGVPMVLPTRPLDVIESWRSHRTRFRHWFSELSADCWSDPTRCSEWSVRDIAQHLISGAQFLGYTLHQARKGQATHLLQGFDAQTTPAVTTAQWDGQPTDRLLAELDAMDGRVEEELDALADAEWGAWAEAPPGKVRAYVAVNHFLFDSWVHERDVMLPAGEEPVVVTEEAFCVASYVLALAGITGRADDGAVGFTGKLVIRLTDINRMVQVDVDDAGASVALSSEAEKPELTAPASLVVDMATGRSVEDGSPTSTVAALLNRLAVVMTGDGDDTAAG